MANLLSPFVLCQLSLPLCSLLDALLGDPAAAAVASNMDEVGCCILDMPLKLACASCFLLTCSFFFFRLCMAAAAMIKAHMAVPRGTTIAMRMANFFVVAPVDSLNDTASARRKGCWTS
jgi:hypothetical protein